jgi:hypothetical protein
MLTSYDQYTAALFDEGLNWALLSATPQPTMSTATTTTLPVTVTSCCRWSAP